MLAVLAAVAAWVVLDSAEEKATTGDRAPVAAKPGGSPAPAPGGETGRFRLPQRTPVGEPRAELFGPQSWQPPASKTAARPPAAVAPPLPYQYAGKVLQDGRMSVLLSKGDRVFPIRVGETLDGAYRVETIGEDEITLIYLPLKHKERIPVVSALPFSGGGAASASARPESRAAPAAGPAAASRVTPASSAGAADAAVLKAPAQLNWEGPQQVRLGARFDVALKLTSREPLHATPMQLRFDPALLELVALKPGRFYGGEGRQFSYRAHADGSIVVGASNQNAAAAAGAELLVVTFRPIKPAPAAELSVASLSLEGVAGQAISFGSPEAFRTTIAP